MTNIRSDNQAFQTLLGDLVENILKYSDNPGACAQYITTQIRELIGVRMVALVSADEERDYTLVGLCPHKREQEWHQPAIRAFVTGALTYRVPRFVDPATDSEGETLLSAGIGKSFVIPLTVGDEPVGMLILLDLMDDAGIESILHLLIRVASILALILKNSLLYERMEQLVKKRTAELVESNAGLLLSEERFRQAIEEAPFPIMIYAEDGEVLSLSKMWTELTGYTLADIPTIEAWARNAYGGNSQPVREGIGTLYALTFPKKEGEFHVTCKDSSTVIWDFSSISLGPLSDGRRTSMSMAFDITDRVKAEEEKLIFEQQLLHTQKLESLGVLSGGIAHDFNNILAIIIGHCSLAGLDPDNAGKHIPEIEHAANRAAGLCRQMLAYAGKAQRTMTMVDMRLLVDEMVSMLTATLPRNAVITADLAAGMPLIHADASQLRQIVMNLIINASEAIGDNQGEIRVSLAETTVMAGRAEHDYHGKPIPPGGYLCLDITDTGCGMDEEVRWRIFEPFFTTKFTGRGLGMSAVLGIIMSHDGAVQLFSQVGRGTTFKIFLPVQARESAGDTARPPSVSPAPWQGSGTILLVEDDDEIRHIAEALLSMFGFTVLEAVNGKEALDVYRKHAAEIVAVMTDVGMPVMDGYTLFRELKKINRRVPIIISSGFGDADVSSRLAGETIAGLISKPYNPETLRDVMKRAVEMAPSAHA